MSITINRTNDWQGTKRQEQAIAYAIRTITERSQSVAGHECVYTIKLEGTDYGTAWMGVDKDVPSLGENSLLRVLETCDGWFISIGERGALNAHRYPKSLRQFKGKSWCRINIK